MHSGSCSTSTAERRADIAPYSCTSRERPEEMSGVVEQADAADEGQGGTRTAS